MVPIKAPVRLLPGIVLLTAQAAIGSAAILARIGMRHGLDAVALAAWRLLLAAVIVVGSLLLRRDRSSDRPFSRKETASLLVAGTCLGLHFLTWFWSLGFIPVARSTLLVTTSPIWSGLAGTLFLGQRMTARFWGGLGLACLGGWGVTLFGPIVTEPSGGSEVGLGDMLAVAGAMFLAAYFLLVQPIQKRHGTRPTVAMTYSVAALSLWAVAALSSARSSILPQDYTAWLMVIGMALIPQMIGHTALNWSLLHFPAGVVGAAMLLEPIFAAGLAFVFFREPITAGQAVSGAVLLLGVGMVLWRPAEQSREE